ncbi:MAG: acetyl-CoA carboxylase biotin carboxyl carrier protein [bacterium]
MADGLPEEQGPDLKTLHRLIKLMHRYGLTAIDLGEGPQKIRLRREPSHQPGSAVAAAPAVALPVAAAPAAAAPAPVAAAKPAEAEATYIKSPMVGTFYSASSPDSPPFASSGTTVRKDSIVCIIEAMKVFTEIPAGTSGTIAEVLVQNGQAVEFGQPLFRLA